MASGNCCLPYMGNYDDGGGVKIPETSDELTHEETCKYIFEALCTAIDTKTTSSDCVCDGVDGELSGSLQTDYIHRLINGIVASGSCDNKARIFRYKSCEEMRDDKKNLICCPQEGDIAIVDSAVNMFDVYVLDNIGQGNVTYECGKHVQITNTCSDEDHFTWRIKASNDIHVSSFVRNGNKLTITETNGGTFDITLPPSSAQNKITDISKNGDTFTIHQVSGGDKSFTVTHPVAQESGHVVSITNEGNRYVLHQTVGGDKPFTIHHPAFPKGFSHLHTNEYSRGSHSYGKNTTTVYTYNSFPKGHYSVNVSGLLEAVCTCAGNPDDGGRRMGGLISINGNACGFFSNSADITAHGITKKARYSGSANWSGKVTDGKIIIKILENHWGRNEQPVLVKVSTYSAISKTGEL